ncbi:MAG: transcription-repair coupling factor, partial [Planctomycetota bacterium]
MTSALQKSQTERLASVVDVVERGASIGAKLSAAGPDETLSFSGVWGALRGVFAAAVAKQSANVLVLLPEAADADIVAGDAEAFGVEQAVALPLSVGSAGSRALVDTDLAERLQVLQTLRQRNSEEVKPLLVTAYIGGAMQLVPTPEQMEEATRCFSVGEATSMEMLARWLSDNGFAATTAVELPGEFATRGGLMDVYGVDHPHPIRIEWFGDEIDSIRFFDLASQRSIESLGEIKITAMPSGNGTETVDEVELGSIAA